MTQNKVLSRVAAVLNQNETFKPYYGQKATTKDDPATKATTVPVPLKIVLSLFHERQIGGAINGDTLALVNHMTPGMSFWCGLTSPVPKYALDVCVPELRKQLPKIANVSLAEDADPDRFYREMVEQFGETVPVTSIAKQIGEERSERGSQSPATRDGQHGADVSTR